MPLTDTPMARLRAQCGLTQRDLARLVGVSQPQISRFESGKSAPEGIALARRLAVALGVSLDALWGGHGPTRTPTHRPRTGAQRRTETR